MTEKVVKKPGVSSARGNNRFAHIRAKISDFMQPRVSSTNLAKLKVTLGQLILLRVVVLSLLLGTSAWRIFQDESSINALYPMFWGIGFTFSISLVNALWLRFTKNVNNFGHGQAFVDTVLATIAIYITGGAGSPLFVLYLFIIVGAAVLFGSRGAIIVAAESGICYALLSSGLITPLDSAQATISPEAILGVYLSLIIIAIASGYLAKQLETVWGIADRHEANLNELSNQQQQLFDDISDGIITVDLEAAITSINKAARAIMGLSEIEAEDLLGRDFPKFLQKQNAGNSTELLEQDVSSDGPMDLVLTRQSHGKDLCLDYTVRPLHNSQGVEHGKLVCFRDVSHVRSMEKRLSLHEQMTKLLAESDHFLSEPIAQQDNDFRIIGESTVMRQVLALIERVACKEASVLISGESGTGKELIAKAVHAHGPRHAKPFIAINCGAIPDNLIESELFGYKKGAFTGAGSNQIGLFRQADGGTVFLDEIGELPLQLQTKLLRVLQERMVRPVGDVHDFPIDVRIVSATNKNLKTEIAEKRFREDLFYRLNVVNIVIPPLRNRTEDIPPLVRYFIGRYADTNEVLPKVSPEVIELLMSYSFPGNIRELENVIERALVLGGQAILPEHLPEELQNRSDTASKHIIKLATSSNELSSETEIQTLPIDLESELAKFEKRYLKTALEQSGGIKKQAAQLLGLNFRSLRYRLKKYGLGEETNSP